MSFNTHKVGSGSGTSVWNTRIWVQKLHSPIQCLERNKLHNLFALFKSMTGYLQTHQHPYPVLVRRRLDLNYLGPLAAYSKKVILSIVPQKSDIKWKNEKQFMFIYSSSTFGWNILFTKPIEGDLYG